MNLETAITTSDASHPGVNFLADLSQRSAEAISRQVRCEKRVGDVVMVSLHWDGNWGYTVSPEQREFARQLIDTAGVDLVHGHSKVDPEFRTTV